MNAETPVEEELPARAAGAPRARAAHIAVIALERYALILLTLGILLFFSFDPATSSTFPTPQNLRNVFGDQSVLVIVTLAALFPLICGEFDFSVGVTATASQIVVAAAAGRHHLGLFVAIALGVGIGLLVGGVNAFVVTRVGISGIITTLGIGTLLSGLVILYTHGGVIVSDIPPALTHFGDNDVLGVPTITLGTLVAALAVVYVLGYTPPGRYLYSVGSNREAARLVGLNVRRLVAGSFVVSATLSGLAGVLLVARNGVGDPQVGNTTLALQALSACFLGATAVRPGRFNVLGAVVAVFFIAFSVSGLSLSGASGWVSDVFTGTALVIAVGVSTGFARRRQNSVARAG